MFPRRARLTREDFVTATTSSRRVTSPLLTIVLPSRGTGYAVVVSKKVARRAVDRHKLKRRIVGVLKTLTLPASLIVYPRLGARSAPKKTLQAELARLLSQ